MAAVSGVLPQLMRASVVVAAVLCLTAASVAASGVPIALNGCPTGALATPGRALLQRSLNFSFNADMAAIGHAVSAGQWDDACNRLALYYYNATGAKNAHWLRHAAVPSGSGVAGGGADAARLNRTYTFYGVTAQVPLNGDGGLDWADYGPQKDREFMYALNRHFVWGAWVQAYLSTGNDVYADVLQERVLDWVSHEPVPSTVPSTANTTWRTLEAGIRSSSSWITGFFGLQNAPTFTASGRVAFLVGLSQHGQYLSKYANDGNANWRTMQYNGLGTLASVFPEFSGSDSWYQTAATGLAADLATGVYPDGVETEETSHYHRVALENSFGLANVSSMSGRTVPSSLDSILQGMFNYLAYCMDQQGNNPLNSDSDLDDFTSYVLSGAHHYSRTDWEYIATNGASGTQPTLFSSMFPYAGQLIMRSGWGRTDQWGFFDVGPFSSSGHGHRDKLHLSVRVGQDHLLVDSGRFAYDGAIANQFRESYAVHTRGHNTVMLDGKPQIPKPPTVSKPLDNETWSVSAGEDRARGSITFDGLDGDGEHERSLVYVRGKCWIVVDRVTSDRSRAVSALWHAHPDTTVAIANGITKVQANTSTSKNGIVVVPVQDSSKNGWKWENISKIVGQLKPEPQGWYSKMYDEYRPSPAVIYDGALNCSGTQCSSTFAWLLLPFQGSAPDVNATIVSSNVTVVAVTVTVGGQTIHVDVNM